MRTFLFRKVTHADGVRSEEIRAIVAVTLAVAREQAGVNFSWEVVAQGLPGHPATFRTTSSGEEGQRAIDMLNKIERGEKRFEGIAQQDLHKIVEFLPRGTGAKESTDEPVSATVHRAVRQRDYLIRGMRQLSAFFEDLKGSNSGGWLKNLCLQDYGRFNDALAYVDTGSGMQLIETQPEGVTGFSTPA